MLDISRRHEAHSTFAYLRDVGVCILRRAMRKYLSGSDVVELHSVELGWPCATGRRFGVVPRLSFAVYGREDGGTGDVEPSENRAAVH